MRLRRLIRVNPTDIRVKPVPAAMTQTSAYWGRNKKPKLAVMMLSEKKRMTTIGRLIFSRAIGTNTVGKKPMKENRDIIRPELAREMPNDFVNISGSQASIAKELNAPMLKMSMIAHATGQRATGRFAFSWFASGVWALFSINSQGTTAISAKMA